MQRNLLSFFISFLMICLFLVPLQVQQAFAAHGCLTNEPDRDEDGVPDKDDPFPDDPLLGGLAEKYCGAEPLTMKLFFIPFSAEVRNPVTKDSIESKKANAIWFCSKNQEADNLLGILNAAAKVKQEVLEAQKLAPNHIRMKLTTIKGGTDDIVYFADKYGAGTKEGEIFTLTPDQMEAIDASVAKITAGCGSGSKTHCDLMNTPA
jgi:hypothetical protein